MNYVKIAEVVVGALSVIGLVLFMEWVFWMVAN